MTKRRWLYLVVGIACLVSLIASGCGEPEPPAEEEEEEENGTAEWCPPIPGMKEGEEDIYYEIQYGSLGAADKYLDTPQWMADWMYERTGGRMDISIVYSGALGGSLEAPELIGAGVYNMGNYWPDYFPEQEPLEQMTMFPMIYYGKMNTALCGTEWFRTCHLHPRVIEQAEEVWNIHKIGVQGQRAYQFVVRDGNSVRSVDDFSGKLMRGVAYYATWAEELGATPIFITYMEIYEALQKGMLDIAPVGYGSIETLRFCEVIDQVIDLGLGGGDCSNVMNLDMWNDLPQYMKDLFEECYFELNYEAHWPYIQAAFDRVEPLLVEWDVEVVKLDLEDELEILYAAQPALKEYVVTCLTYDAPIEEYLWDLLEKRHLITGEEWPVLYRADFDDFMAECKAEAGV
jgi:TRAP-type C4-dicarboxylate transport system substrate-binding protein